MPDWLPPFLAATLTILLLNLALLEQRRRAHRRSWDRRLLRELRAWDGRLPVWGAKKLGAHPEKSAICRQDANFGTLHSARRMRLRDGGL